MSESEGEAADASGKAVTPLSLPGQIVSDIIEQAPVYGLSGAIFAVGMVTGRRALARSGAKMLVGQLLAAMTRVAVDRILPGQKEPDGESQPVEPASVDAPPVEEKTAESGKARSATIATGALIGVAAAAGAGWLLRRLLASKPAEDEAD